MRSPRSFGGPRSRQEQSSPPPAPGKARSQDASWSRLATRRARAQAQPGPAPALEARSAGPGLYDLRSFYGATEELWFPREDLRGAPWDSDQYERWSPSNFVKNFKTPALVITGELDFRVPYTQSLQYFTALQERGVPSRLVVFPKAGHWPGWQEMMYYYAQHLDWFHRYLGGEPSKFDLEQWDRLRAIPLNKN